jgi:hypothetical protein
MSNMPSVITERPRSRRRFRLLGAVIATIAFAAGLSAVALQSESTPASAAVTSFSQCNAHAPGPLGAPLDETCSVTIENTINALGQTSTVVYVRVCTLEGCTGDIATGDAVNAVHQCNGSNNVGGSTTTCSVNIVNNISIDSPQAATALTLNQCVGSSATSDNSTTCIPSSQGSPTVTQCNGSGNGGGTAMTCTASGTVSSDFPVTVDQCNGSENGGGSVVICNVTMTNNIIDTSVPDTPPTGTPGGDTPPTGTPGGDTPPTGTPGGGPGTGTPGTPETGSPGTPGTPETGTPGTPGTGTPPFVEVPPNYTG